MLDKIDGWMTAIDEYTLVIAAALLSFEILRDLVRGRLSRLKVFDTLASLSTQIPFLAMAIAALALFGIAAAPLLIVVFVLFQGAGYGVTSILRPVLVAQLLGRRKFGIVAGMLAVPHLTVFALAPTIAGLIWGLGGYDMVIVLAALAALIGLVALVLAARAAPLTDRPSG